MYARHFVTKEKKKERKENGKKDTQIQGKKEKKRKPEEAERGKLQSSFKILNKC